MRQTGDNLRKGSTITCHLFGIEKKKEQDRADLSTK